MATPKKPKAAKKNKGGAPKIKQSQKDRILDLIATSNKGIRKLCEENKGLVPAYSTVRKYLAEDKKFIDQYARAKEDQADVLADEMIEIADNCTDDVTILTTPDGEPGREVINHSAINRAKLQIDTRKWIASKLKPKKYGAAVDLTTGGDKLTFNVSVTDD
jgi:hypothetical protein